VNEIKAGSDHTIITEEVQEGTEKDIVKSAVLDLRGQ